MQDNKRKRSFELYQKLTGERCLERKVKTKIIIVFSSIKLLRSSMW